MSDNIERRAYKSTPKPKRNGPGRPKGVKNGNGYHGGRPSGYDPTLHPLVVRYMRREGLTEVEIAKKLGTNITTLKRWKEENPEFKESLMFDRLQEMETVVQSLYSLTQGWDYVEKKEVKERMIIDKIQVGQDLKGKPIYAPIYGEDWQAVRRETQTKKVLPNVAAIQFYLANKAFQPSGGYGIDFGTGWRRSDPQPPKPGQGDDLKTPEAVAQAMMKESGMGMEVV